MFFRVCIRILFAEEFVMRKIEDILKDEDADPMGSYTGVVTDEFGNPLYEEPVQDADDL